MSFKRVMLIAPAKAVAVSASKIAPEAVQFLFMRMVGTPSAGGFAMARLALSPAMSAVVSCRTPLVLREDRRLELTVETVDRSASYN
jgi:hypothetical protein